MGYNVTGMLLLRNHVPLSHNLIFSHANLHVIFLVLMTMCRVQLGATMDTVKICGYLIYLMKVLIFMNVLLHTSYVAAAARAHQIAGLHGTLAINSLLTPGTQRIGAQASLYSTCTAAG